MPERDRPAAPTAVRPGLPAPRLGLPALRLGLPAVRSVVVREVGPRDGLQSEAPILPRDRARLIDRLAQAGCRRIEAVSFVSEKAVPAMAGAAEVLAAITERERIHLVALVPNLRGAEAALSQGVDELTATVAASPTYNERNVRRSIADSVEEIRSICALAGQGGVGVDAVVSCAFGSPYEGDIAAGTVASLCEQLRHGGAAAITLADTTGMATPRLVHEILAATGQDVGLHLHDSRGTALLNAYAALEAGAGRFDTAVGGLGGSPFADGAGGNLATEDLVALLDDLGIHCGVDLAELLEISAFVAGLVGHEVPSRLVSAGPRRPLRPSPT